MRTALITIVGLAMGMSAVAQAPPKNAVDITDVPATASQTAAMAPSATVAAPRAVVRIYISNLNGADATALQGLLTQALFDSKQVVITENQANASLTLQGRVLRQLPAMPESTASRRRRKRRTPVATPPDMTDPSVIKDLNALGGTNLSSITNLDNQDSGDTIPPALGLSNLDNSTADLKQYQFRLDLQLINPEGDLVWMSGQGSQAPPFASASDAVHATVPPMLAAIVSLTKGGQPQP